MNLKNRVTKLESMMLSETEPLKISRFIVKSDDFEPIGYGCSGVEIFRQLGESTEALQNRCSNSVEWLNISFRPIFNPLERKPKKQKTGN